MKTMNKLTPVQIRNMPYVQFMALLDEVNRPPGGMVSLRQSVQNAFIDHTSKVLDIGCNTGYCTFEIAHLAKAKVTGIDISKDMVGAAKRFQASDPSGHLVKFLVADGMKIPFKDETFDVAFSGGSTAFIQNKQQAIREYTRVVKSWGFVVDINFFYHKLPPASLLNELNELLGIHIEPWNFQYWTDLYKNCELEQHYIFTDKVKLVSQKKIDSYCHAMAKKGKYSAAQELAIYDKLNDAMSLFNKNHKHLSYGVFINRKRPYEEQVTLFD